jgi:diguanylate cyclase (GGDEF)-like protein
MRKLLQRQLRDGGYNVFAFENGAQALEKLREVGAGLVLADWEMPELDGLALCRTIRGLCRLDALDVVYLILVTARTSPDSIVAGLEAGADDYLTKPYHVRELLARIRAGERILRLHADLKRQRIEVHKVNAQINILNTRLRSVAYADELTGIASRRHLLERLRELWSCDDRLATPFGLVLFDIDRFKSVNDSHGHTAGDEVLRAVAATIKGAVRPYDVVGRFGGEEFLLICPHVDLHGAAAAAERVRATVAANPVRVSGLSLSVQVSAGVACRDASDHGPDDLIARADAMLYAAKSAGRNQVWVSESATAVRRLNPAGVG